jgi:hypothetical protein
VAPARRLAALLAFGLTGVMVASVGGCGFSLSDERASAGARVDRFSGARAFAYASYQVSLGPRPAGSAASATLARNLRARLPAGRFEPVPGGLRNVVGRLPGRRPAIVIAAHYDTKAIPGFVGANDGAAGTAAVVELARRLPALRRPGARELRFVLFDGEESPASAPDAPAAFLRSGLRGSRAYVRAHRREVGDVVLLDFVGDRSLSLPREQGSDPRLWARLRQAAVRVGVGRHFPARTVGEVYDDHTPFARAGIRAIDLIDFEYPPFHTRADTLDKIAPGSLDAVGEAVTELVRGL